MTKLINQFVTALKLPRWRGAMLVAAVSDALGFGVALAPPLQWLLDGVTVIALFAVLGFRWPLLPALVFEAVPVLALFPAWTLVVAAMASTESAKQAEAGGAAATKAAGVQSAGAGSGAGRATKPE